MNIRQQKPLTITSKDNRWIKLASRLQEKKYREKEKAFWLEGERAMQEVLQNLSSVRAFFVREDQWTKWQDRIPESCWTQVFLLPEKLAAHLSAAETFSGIGVIVQLPTWDIEDILKKRGTLLYLDHIADPGNMGTMIRTAKAFGLNGVLLSPGCVDPFNPKVVRSAMGMLLSFPIFQSVSAEDLWNTAEKYGFQIIGATLKEESQIHYEYPYVQSEILVIGSEAFGITPQIDKICHHYVKIPISFSTESLNAAVACGIILAEKNRQQDIYRISS